MIEHKYNKKKQEYTKKNICFAAAIYGLKDGTPYAVSHNWPGLSTYEIEQETDYGKEMVTVKEWETMREVAGGSRKPGIRIGGDKYIFLQFDQTYKSAKLAGPKGGACACKTKELVIIGIWSKEHTMSNNLNQNDGDCNMQVEDMAEYFRGKGI